MSGPLEFREQRGVGIPSVLRNLTSLALAVIDDNAILLEANAGFRRLIHPEGDEVGMDVSSYFLNPTFEALKNAPARTLRTPDVDATVVFAGRITIGTRDRAGATLVAEVHRIDGRLLLIGEHPIEALRSLANEMIAITAQMAERQRELIKSKKELERREAELETLATTDPLTGLTNRRYLAERLDEEIARSIRTGTSLSLIMLDLDHFKEFNDTWGHLYGDACLQAVARVLEESTRPYDTAARFGGEEFVLILPGVELTAAVDRAESLRRALSHAQVPGVDEKVTASFGVATYTDGSADDLLRRADQALYAAKNAGRNRVGVADHQVDS